MAEPKDLVINEFNKGIGSSYLSEFMSTENIDINSIPGVAQVNYKTTKVSPAVVASTSFVASTTENTFTAANHGLSTYQAITFSTTGTLPNPITADTYYYVSVINANTFKVATSAAKVDSGTFINLTTAGSSSTFASVDIGLVQKFVRDPLATGSYFRVWAIDDNGVIWTNYISDTWIPMFEITAARNIEVFDNYLVIFRGSKVDIYGSLRNISAGTASYTADWQTDNESSFEYHSLIASNGFLYNGGGNYVSSLNVIVGQTFDPTSGATYTWNAQALDLPSEKEIKSMDELYGKLVIGTQIGLSDEDKSATLYSWDKTSSTYDEPIEIEEKGILGIIAFDNVAYLVGGTEGRFYATNLSSASMLKQLPKTMMDLQGTTGTLSINANALIRHKGKIFFGLVTSKTGKFPEGIYSLDINTGVVNHESLISTGSTGENSVIAIDSLLSIDNDKYYIGWSDGTTYGIDKVDTSGRHSSAYIVTGVKMAGTKRNKRTFKHTEIILGKPLATGNSITVSYRSDVQSSYTEIGTFDSVNEFNYVIDKSITVDNIQLKIGLETNSASDITPELIEVRMS